MHPQARTAAVGARVAVPATDAAILAPHPLGPVNGAGCGSSRPRYATPNGRSLATISGEPDGPLDTYCGKPGSLASAVAGIPMPRLVRAFTAMLDRVRAGRGG